MRIGINYPWYKYAWDFGPPVDNWGPRAAWRNVISEDLAAFQRYGVTIVRWFVLADGITYGTGRNAPHRDSEQWRFDRVPTLDSTVLEDFSDLLQLFARAEIQLLPVLIDFHWAFPGLDCETRDSETLALWHTNRERASSLPEGYVRGGRGDVIYDYSKSTRFYRHVLVPFLEVSQRYHRTIYAWELINEPEWVTRQHGLGGRLVDAKRIPLVRMLGFIRDGLTIIGDYGFRPTVGFAKPHVLGDWEARTMRRSQAQTRTQLNPGDNYLGLGLNQIHYYPHDGDRLVSASFPNGMPGILGEFATRIRGLSAHTSQECPGSYWPDLGDDQQHIAWRLRRARALGYTAALPWSYRADDCATEPDRNVIEAALSEPMP